MPPIPLNITAKHKARKHLYSMFYEDDGLLFCNVGIDSLCKAPLLLLVFNLTVFFRDAQCTVSSVVILTETSAIAFEIIIIIFKIRILLT